MHTVCAMRTPCAFQVKERKRVSCACLHAAVQTVLPGQYAPAYHAAYRDMNQPSRWSTKVCASWCEVHACAAVPSGAACVT